MNKTTYTGYSADTVNSIIMDAGAFFKNFEYGTDTYASAVAAGKLLGATQGGGEFSAVPTLRQLQIDGVKGNSTLKAIDGWDVTLTANMIEITDTMLALMLPGSVTTAGAGTVKHKLIEGSNYIEDTDYISNITFIGKVRGNSEPIIIQVLNALCTTGVPLKTADNKEVIIPAKFSGHQTPTTTDKAPFKIYYPKTEAAALTSVTLAKGSAAPVGAVVNVAIPDDGGTDTTGAITGWVTGTANKIKITVVDKSPAVSTITINAAAYVSGADYVVTAATPLSVIITTTETGMRTCVRTFTIPVTAAP